MTRFDSTHEYIEEIDRVAHLINNNQTAPETSRQLREYRLQIEYELHLYKTKAR